VKLNDLSSFSNFQFVHIGFFSSYDFPFVFRMFCVFFFLLLKWIFALHYCWMEEWQLKGFLNCFWCQIQALKDLIEVLEFPKTPKYKRKTSKTAKQIFSLLTSQWWNISHREVEDRGRILLSMIKNKDLSILQICSFKQESPCDWSDSEQWRYISQQLLLKLH